MIHSDSTPHDVQNRKVALLATHGFEYSELADPLTALDDAGADTTVVSLPESDDAIRGWSNGNWADSIQVDATLTEVTADDFEALVLPGGVMNPDRLRQFTEAVDFVRDFFEAGKPVSAICHAPWLIVEAGAADNRRMTSWPGIRTDLENAGATWVDEEVVVDQGLVTSRSPADMDAFIFKTLEEISEGRHAGQHA
jgi:protease I